MIRSKVVPVSLVVAFLFACSKSPTKPDDGVQNAQKAKQRPDLILPGETHFKSLTQLTFGGENAEAYFNAAGDQLIFQSTRDDLGCDQIFRMDVDGGNVRMVSTGEGRTTCGFLFPEGDRIIFSSSHATLKECPPRPDYSKGYVWPLLQDFDIYIAGPNGEEPTALSPSPGYDAEGVISPNGDRILFTSTRGGDIDIWSMAPDGSDLKQLTDGVGYDGGAFFSPDGSKIVWRAKYPTTEAEMKDYKSLLAENLVRPSVMDLYTMDADGSNKKMILSNGFANFAPYFHPDGKRIVFASNMDAPAGRDFELYIINTDGTGLERVTYNETFDAFPMFSDDGTKLIFSSNRGGANEGDTNVFIAEWTDETPAPIESKLGEAKPSVVRWTQNVTELASEKMGGRGVGTPELENAATFLETQFKTMGLEPGIGDSYRQTFETVVSSKIGKATLKVGKSSAKYKKDFRPFPFTGSTKADGKTTFVGHGITSGEYKLDDYAGKKLDGNIAVAFRFEPERDDPKSKYAGKEPIRESLPRYKTFMAEHMGATGLIIVNPPDLKEDKLHDMQDGPSNANIPVAHLTWDAGKRLFGQVLEDQWNAMDDGQYDAPVDLKTTVQLEIDIKQDKKKTSNIVAKLNGSGDAYFVVGAHYDHLGNGGASSLAPGVSKPHPGADDNASGVAGVLELARALKAAKPKHTVYFVLFTGEETGLLGSEYFANNPPEDLANLDMMLNFDMIGRLKDRDVNVLGTGTGEQFVNAVRRSSVGLDVNVTMTPDGFGPSDQTPFYSRKIPVLHFFTGLHDDYHRPTDTVEKLNPAGAVDVITMALRVLVLLDDEDVTYVQVRSAGKRPTAGNKKRSYGPYFGSVPSFAKPKQPGVKITGTRPGSPADKAGVKPDDVLVKFGDYDVKNMQDYAFAIRQYKPGDDVDVVVVRGDKKVTLKAKLVKKSETGKEKSPHK